MAIKLTLLVLAVATFALCNAKPSTDEAGEIKRLLKALHELEAEEAELKGGAEAGPPQARETQDEKESLVAYQQQAKPTNLKTDRACPNWSCFKYCQNGFKKDENGCDICECMERKAAEDMVAKWGFSSSSSCKKLSTCGKQYASKIIGGSTTDIKKLPWQVKLEINNKPPRPGYYWGSYGACGGTILSENWIATAAHCFGSNLGYNHGSGGKLYQHYVRVKYGNSMRNAMDEVLAAEVWVHKSYVPPSLKNDIALIKLETPLTFGAGIQPICLRADSAKVADKTRCTVSGWGQTYNDQSSSPADWSSPQLKELIVPIDDTCGNNNNIDKETQVCAGDNGDGSDSCQGDSGGPLACPNSSYSAYYLEGIVSYGYQCGIEGWPGVYTRVSAYMTNGWIQDIIKGDCYDRS